MKEPTKSQRARLAREARRLAGQIAEDRAPDLNPMSYCGCAIGVLMRRALGVSVPAMLQTEADREAYDLARYIDDHFNDDFGCVGIVSRELAAHGSRGAVFPLLALADGLEAK